MQGTAAAGETLDCSSHRGCGRGFLVLGFASKGGLAGNAVEG